MSHEESIRQCYTIASRRSAHWIKDDYRIFVYEHDRAERIRAACAKIMIEANRLSIDGMNKLLDRAEEQIK